jgi:asparagine synthase (glutamine-hydrolysing)
MCGICGVFEYGRSDGAVRAEEVERMMAAMLHRGPDEGGRLIDGDFGMGMRRLSIIDLCGGSQPITAEDGEVSIVFNGEIYNFRSLRARLEAAGHKFSTRTDTEVILHGYEEWGAAVTEHLNGMFAFAVWDHRSRELFVARDHYGIKPLYYWAEGGCLAFGSEIRALFASGRVGRAIDPVGLGQFLRYRYVPSPRTAFAGISKLPPGHSLSVTTGGVCRVGRFSRPVQRQLDLGLEQATEMLEAALRDSVSRQMVADVPVGLMLSGGVDSALLGSLMAEASSLPVRTFTVAFAEDSVTNELAAAAGTARRMGADHHELVISQEEYLEHLPAAIAYLEEPVATPSTLAFGRLCAFARTEVTVALAGQGADEPFGGYARYAFEQKMAQFPWVPPSLVEVGLRCLSTLRPWDEKLLRAAQAVSVQDPAERVEAVNRVIEDPLLDRLIGGGALRGVPVANPFTAWCNDVLLDDPCYRLQYVDVRTMLSDNLLLYGDKTSMSASLELRVPYLDREVAELAESFATDLKVHGREHKRVLRAVAAKFVDQGTLTRPKVNFAVPIREWLRGELGDELQRLARASESLCAAWLDSSAVDAMLDEHRRGRRDYSHILFSLLVVEMWHSHYIIGTGGVADVGAGGCGAHK